MNSLSRVTAFAVAAAALGWWQEIARADLIQSPRASAPITDVIGFLKPMDDVDKLIAEFNGGKGDPKARATIVRAIARSFSQPQQIGVEGTQRSGINAKILTFLQSQATNDSMDIAREATLGYSRIGPPDQAAATVRGAYQSGKIETEHFFRETIVQLPGLWGTKAQDDAVDGLIVTSSFRSEDAPPMALSRLLAAYTSSAPFTAAINPINKEKIDGYLIGQEPVFSGPRFDQMAAVHYSQWLEARARLRGVTDAEIPAFMISQLQSSAGSADKITAVMLSQYGPKVAEVATPTQRQGMLSTLTSPQRSQALMSDPRTDLRAIAIQMLNK